MILLNEKVNKIYNKINKKNILFPYLENNGMAAIINPLGNIENKIDYGVSGYIDFELRKDLDKTIFSMFGNTIFIIFILLYIFLIFSFNRIRNE